MATATLTELISQTRLKANVLRSNFATDTEIIGYLNEARKQFRELVITADDSYYQATLDFSVSAQPLNEQVLPSTFWKMRGLDAWAGDSLRQREIYARPFANRFDPGLGYYFGGTGNSIVCCGDHPEQANPFRLYYTPKPLPLAAVTSTARSTVFTGIDGTNAGAQIILGNGKFSAADVGATLVIANSLTPVDGTYTILTVVDATHVTTAPSPTPSQSFDSGVIVTLTPLATATRTFAVAPADSQSTGFWILQNGQFGIDDVGSYMTITINAPNASYSGSYQILAVNNATTIQVTPAISGASPALTGTATISRQPPNTENSLDLTEDNFSEYFSVRAGMVIARKKRQDTLVAALGGERAAIEDRIAALSRMRQSEPQQAPVLWGRRAVYTDDFEV